MTLPHYPKLTAAEIAVRVGTSPLMLEIGAADGEDTVEFLKAMPGIRLHCFEPDPRAAAKFKRTVGEHHPNVVFHEAAVSDVDGAKPFYASTGKAGHLDDWYLSGSLRKPTGHLARSPEIAFKEPVDVPCVRLDSWLDVNVVPGAIIDFIWADTQASEGDLIIGGRQTLARTRYLYTEFYDSPLYLGQLNLKQLYELLWDGVNDWELLGIYEGENALFQNNSVDYVRRQTEGG